MIKAVKENVWTTVEKFYFPEEEDKLRKALTFKVSNYQFTKSFKNQMWDGYYSFYNVYSKRFLTGLFLAFPEELSRLFITVDIRKRPFTIGGDPILRGIKLRDYQEQAIMEAYKEERCVITAPCNAGKTIIAIGIIKLLRPVRVLWLTHRANLMTQTTERLRDCLREEIGLIHGDTFEIKRVTVGMVPTIYWRLNSKNKAVRRRMRSFLANHVDGLVIDECHHSSGFSWRLVAKACNAYYRIGLSATPFLRGEIQNMWLLGLTGKEIKTVTNKDLINRGISARPRIIRLNNTLYLSRRPARFRTAYRKGIEDNEERNKVIAGLIKKHVAVQESVLCLTNTIRHAENIMALTDGTAVFLAGYQSVEYRDAVLRQFERGKVKAIVATPLFDEGIDVPICKVLILAGGGKSHLKLLQRVGRVLRRNPSGQQDVVVYDFADKGDKYLENHSLHRLKLYRSEGFDIVTIDYKFKEVS